MVFRVESRKGLGFRVESLKIENLALGLCVSGSKRIPSPVRALPPPLTPAGARARAIGTRQPRVNNP